MVYIAVTPTTTVGQVRRDVDRSNIGHTPAGTSTPGEVGAHRCGVRVSHAAQPRGVKEVSGYVQRPQPPVPACPHGRLSPSGPGRTMRPALVSVPGIPTSTVDHGFPGFSRQRLRAAGWLGFPRLGLACGAFTRLEESTQDGRWTGRAATERCAGAGSVGHGLSRGAPVGGCRGRS